ncbi:hypothetical protein HELRODRAFT_113035 [Helobdella robusta]|uniref:RAVE complex protein Rav1 C-terminal domain-containing protein n=1 Tax=Helobdella robusta TaxID=6412 RepID=T1EFP8_HELRO|nr:hypothetical protein HELRODRAFT_113035 [Helobdella robusta]ESO00911.1 hypothetical protein HELRODRAFT_113035 [Helobdella robusta]
MAQFFKNNFQEDRWRRAALKNAFTLIGKQRFQCAAAFFILAGAIQDAVEVCLKNLNDMQLAIVVLRLYEQESAAAASSLSSSSSLSYKKLLSEKILGSLYRAATSTSMTLTTSSDPFLRSMAKWILNDYTGSLETLLQNEDDDDDSSVFNFYIYLRSHPLILKQQQVGKIQKMNSLVDKFAQVNCVTPVERRLYFMTAHEHLRNGCPALALEVLMKLPPMISPQIDDDNDDNVATTVTTTDTTTTETTTTITADAINSNRESANESAGNFMNEYSTAEAFDWSQPVYNSMKSRDNDDDQLVLDFSVGGDDDDSGDDDDDDMGRRKKKKNVDDDDGRVKEEDDDGAEGEKKSKMASDNVKQQQHDVMAQQFKFIACLRMIADELATLAAGFGVDGGQLRYQLYYWLESEVEVLRRVCSYQEDHTSSISCDDDEDDGVDDDDFFLETKRQRIRKKRKWLRANHNLLVTLLSYTILHDSNGGGYASVRTEILLLLQPKNSSSSSSSSNSRLLSKPLPIPRDIPMLTSALIGPHSVVTDLLQYLGNMCHDLLSTFACMGSPPDSSYPRDKIYHIFAVGAGLSSCVYQSLSGDHSSLDNSNTTPGLDGGLFAFGQSQRESYLLGRAGRRSLTDDYSEAPKSEPSKWPGVSYLTSLLKKIHEDDAPQLITLLLQSLLSVYLSLLCYSLATYDAPVISRLIGQPLNKECWGTVFGGGVKQLVKMAPVSSTSRTNNSSVIVNGAIQQQQQQQMLQQQQQQLQQQQLQQQQQQRFHGDSYREKFIPPKMSIINYFLSRSDQQQQQTSKKNDDDDDDDAEDDDDDDDNDGDVGADDDYAPGGACGYGSARKKNKKASRSDTTHLDPDSLPWKLIRYAVVRYVNVSLGAFLPAIGLEPGELDHSSSLLDSVVKNLLRWEAGLRREVDGSSDSIEIPNLYVEPTSLFGNVTIQKYSSLMDSKNTPFLSKHKTAKPAKKLWTELVSKPQLQDIFIKYVFKSKKLPATAEITTSGFDNDYNEPMKIIHKDQDVITSFAINQVVVVVVVVEVVIVSINLVVVL